MRARRRRLLALALAGSFVAAASPFASATPRRRESLPVLAEPRFSARVSANGGRVVVSGRLLSPKAQGLGGRRVNLSLDGRWLASQTTDPDGSFNFSHQVPEGTPEGPHEVLLSTDPVTGMVGTVFTVKVNVGRNRRARLSARLVDSAGRPSERVRVVGRVTDGAGRPLEGISLQGHHSSGQWTDTFSTDARGNFSGSFSIPLGTPAGRSSLSIVVLSLSGYAATPVPLAFTVLPGSPQRPASSAPSRPAAPVEPSDDPTSAASPTPTPAATPAPVTTTAERTPRQPAPAGAWGLGALVGVGAIASVLSMGRSIPDEPHEEGRLIGERD